MNIKTYKIIDLLDSEEYNHRLVSNMYIYISEGDDYNNIYGNLANDIIATVSIYDKPNGNEIYTHDFTTDNNGFFIFYPSLLNEYIRIDDNILSKDVLRFYEIKDLEDDSSFNAQLLETLNYITTYFSEYSDRTNEYNKFVSLYGTPSFQVGNPTEGESYVDYCDVVDNILNKKGFLSNSEIIDDLQTADSIMGSLYSNAMILISFNCRIIQINFMNLNFSEICNYSYNEKDNIFIINTREKPYQFYAYEEFKNIGLLNALDAIISANKTHNYDVIEWDKLILQTPPRYKFSIVDVLSKENLEHLKLKEYYIKIPSNINTENNEVVSYIPQGDEMLSIGNIKIYAPKSGYYEYIIPRRFYRQYLLKPFIQFTSCEVWYKERWHFFESLRKFNFNVKVDRFTKAKTIEWKDSHHSFPILREGITDFVYILFDCIDDNLYITIGYYNKKTKLLHNKYDEYFAQYNIYLLLENDESFILNNRKYVQTTFNPSGAIFLEYKLEKELLYSFITNAITAIRIDSPDISLEYDTESAFFKLFKQYAKQFAYAVGDDFSEINTTRNKTYTESCFVYLMHDFANGYYKIGISNKPEYREHTLQSEKPTIELIIAKEFPIRRIAEAFEAALHKTYETKRLRGEWFRLDIKDVEDLIKALS